LVRRSEHGGVDKVGADQPLFAAWLPPRKSRSVARPAMEPTCQ
jgi:hypothetical protein